MHKKILSLMLFVPLTVIAAERGLTEQTGQEILKELKAIRLALEKRPLSTQGAPMAAAPRVKVSAKGLHALGSETAPVTLVEFSDYQCPYCKKFFDTTFPEIKKNYIDTGKVRFVSRNFPLAFHNNAKKATQAALCAGDQGKYWDMRGELFRNMQALEPAKLPGYAQGLKLDIQQFNDCLGSDSHLARIDEDMKDAQSLAISGTPSFILGTSVKEGLMEGEKIVGAQPYAAFEMKIKSLLKEKN